MGELIAALLASGQRQWPGTQYPGDRAKQFLQNPNCNSTKDNTEPVCEDTDMLPQSKQRRCNNQGVLHRHFVVLYLEVWPQVAKVCLVSRIPGQGTPGPLAVQAF